MNFNAISYQEVPDINSSNLLEPPLPKLLSDEEIENVKRGLIKFQHSCSNQAVERHRKLVGDSSLFVCGFQKRDKIIPLKLCPRKLMKDDDTKK